MARKIKHPEVFRELQNARLAYKRCVDRLEFSDTEYKATTVRLIAAESAAREVGYSFRSRRTSVKLT